MRVSLVFQVVLMVKGSMTNLPMPTSFLVGDTVTMLIRGGEPEYNNQCYVWHVNQDRINKQIKKSLKD